MSPHELWGVPHCILHGTVPAVGSQCSATIKQELDKKNAGKRGSSFQKIARYSLEEGSLAISQNVAFNLHIALTALAI